MNRRRTAVTALVLAGAIGLAGCGTNREEGGGTATGGDAATGECDTSKGELVIGMIAPLSGDLTALGFGMRNSADLAIQQANEACTVTGYSLRLQAEDDQALPQIANQAAGRIATDDNVVGVIGTLNSSTAQTVQPVLADRDIVMISPANTSPALTKGEDLEDPERPFANYFRTAATDDLQGPYGAEYLVNEAGITNIAVINDGKTYGAGLAAAFQAAAEELGATIVATEQVGENDTDFSGVIANIRAANPGAVYYGGEYPAGGPMSQQLAQAGLNIPLMGGDALNSPEFIALGGKDGDFATSVGAPTADVPSAQQFISDYEAGGFAEPYETYGALTYDATNVVIQALASSLGDGDWSADSRTAVVEAVQATDIEGATGELSFDEFGDTNNKVLTLYGVEGGELVPVTSGVYEQG